MAHLGCAISPKRFRSRFCRDVSPGTGGATLHIHKMDEKIGFSQHCGVRLLKAYTNENYSLVRVGSCLRLYVFCDCFYMGATSCGARKPCILKLEKQGLNVFPGRNF